jgi:hypothetical protein
MILSGPVFRCPGKADKNLALLAPAVWVGRSSLLQLALVSYFKAEALALDKGNFRDKKVLDA